MSKYIIDTNKYYLHEFDGALIVMMHEGKPVSVYELKDNLEELNSDYINKNFGELQDEAYQRGINDGSLDVKQRVEGAYQRGLDDAWEAARKIVTDTDHGGIASGTLCEIFGTRGYSYIMQENTAQEAVDKIKAYEDKHSSIKMGDEVIWSDGTTLVVTMVYEDGGFNWCDGTSQDGRAYHVLLDNVRKTGKHYDIQSILEAMRK